MSKSIELFKVILAREKDTRADIEVTRKLRVRLSALNCPFEEGDLVERTDAVASRFRIKYFEPGFRNGWVARAKRIDDNGVETRNALIGHTIPLQKVEEDA